LLPSFPNSETDRIQTLWTELLQINLILSKPEDKLSNVDFESKAQDWVRKFTDVYPTKNVTPYIIHAMGNHVSQFMKLHGSVISFTQQGLKKHDEALFQINKPQR
jgi:hypothetical protein